MGRVREEKIHTANIIKTQDPQKYPQPKSEARVNAFYAKITANRLEPRFIAYMQNFGERRTPLQEICKVLNEDFKMFLPNRLSEKDIRYLIDHNHKVQAAFALGTMGSDVSKTMVEEHMLSLALGSTDTKDVLNYFKMKREIATIKKLEETQLSSGQSSNSADNGIQMNLNITVGDD